MAVEENWTMFTNLTDTTILKINFWHRQRRTIQNKRDDYPTSQITFSKRCDNVTFSLLQRNNFTF